MPDLPIEEPTQSPQPTSIAVSPVTRRLTTALVLAWGLFSAIALAYGSVIAFDLRVILAAIVPLAAVWAALDRKRWGRMTLIFVGSIAWLGYLLAFVYTLLTGKTWIDGEFSLPNYAYMALRMMWADYPEAGMIGLTLAAITLVWMFRSTVIAEFAKGRQHVLSFGQKLIASILAFFWLYAMLFTPLTPLPTKRTGPASSLPPPPPLKPGID